MEMKIDSKDYENLVRENERMKVALLSVKTYAETCIMGAWRQYVYDFAHNGLTKR
jgi:hypothetical protein